MFDIQFLKSKGCKLNKELFDSLYKYWNELHGENNRSDLDQTADSFFNNALSTPHDYYHTILKEVPTYTKVLKDGAEVAVCQDKFNNLSFEEKPQLVQTPNQKRKSEVSVPIDNCAIPTSPTFKKQRTPPTEKRNKKEGPVCTEEQSSVSATLVDPTVEDDAPFNEKEIKDNYNKLLVFMCAYEQVCFTLF
jgi:hypothetical protein